MRVVKRTRLQPQGEQDRFFPTAARKAHVRENLFDFAKASSKQRGKDAASVFVDEALATWIDDAKRHGTPKTDQVQGGT